MAGARTQIKIDKAELQRLEGLMAEQAKIDPKGLMPRLGEYLMRSTEQRFKSQTAPDGTPWQALNPDYAEAKKYNKGKILTLRGYLRRYIHYQIPDANTVEVGSNLKYAAIHQFGGTIRPKAGKALSFGGRFVRSVTIPARPYLGISVQDDKAIREIIRDWLTERGLR